MADSTPIAVVAIGGNSLIKDNKHPEVRHQWDAVRETTKHIAALIEDGWNVVVTPPKGADRDWPVIATVYYDRRTAQELRPLASAAI